MIDIEFNDLDIKITDGKVYVRANVYGETTIDEFEKITSKLYVCTNDGSYGERGFVTDVMVEEGLLDKNYYCCGPLVMMKQVRNISNARGELSLEERMGCGFGACMGCSIETVNGPKRICKEGPVFNSEELLWED